MSKFQLILLFIFGAFIIAAVVIFSLSRAGSGASAAVTVWGDLPSSAWNSMSEKAGFSQNSSLSISYVEKNPETMLEEFTEALAEGRGPDLIILSLSDLWQEKNRLLPIPYTSISESDFASTFIEEGELFAAEEGIYALPLFVDPLVLYYNRNTLSRAGQALPITHWDEIYDASAELTEKDGAGNIGKSVIALGEASNIANFKPILSLLLLQAGTPITGFSGVAPNIELRSVLRANPGLPLAPAEAALDFYTQFSNPAKSFYSWNRSQLPAETHFAAGDSAYYVGFASELPILRAKNPTLNIGVAPVPQSRVSERKITFGELKGVAITRGAKNGAAALAAALSIVSRDASTALSTSLSLPPARRDLLSQRPSDPALAVFWTSALQASGFVDPDSSGTEAVFKEMIESVTSGRARITEAVAEADREIEALIK